MDNFEDSYFTLNRKILSLIGLWHTQTYRERSLRYYIIGFIFFYSIHIQLCNFYKLDLNIQSVAITLQIFIPTLCYAIIYCTYVLNYITIQTIFNYVKQDWKGLKDNMDLKIMEKYSYESKLLILTGSFMCVFYVSLLIFPSILHKILSTNEIMGNANRFPMPSCFDYIIDRETYYYPILIHQILLLTIGTIVAIACYSMHLWVIQHACARLSIIKGRIYWLFKNNHYNDDIVVKPSDLSDWMIDVIQYLARTTEIVTLANTLSGKCFLLQILLAFFLLVVDLLCMPALLQNEENKKNALMFVISTFGTLFVLFINCHVGQRLMNYSADVYQEACLIPFHNTSLKTQKLLLMMLTMSAKPYVLSIGKMFVSSHEFFSDLLRMSLSFTIMLHSTEKFGV